LEVPPGVASQIPAIAFKIPDLDGVAKLELKSPDDNSDLACLTSVVQNGKTTDVAGAKYAAAGIAAAALVLSSISALGAGGGASAAGASPNFGEVMMWFQGIAMDGMLSVNYPSVYRSFTNNFQWSTGLIFWQGMQHSIDEFRAKTGGNLTDMTVGFLMNNATLIFDQSAATGSNTTKSNKMRRALDSVLGEIYARGDLNSTANANANATSDSKVMRFVHGIQAKAEMLMIPDTNTFMTVLLWFAIVIAAIAVLILLFKVILEVWALFGSFPKGLTGFRKRYWTFLITTIVRLVLILYGTWTLYCLYQFKNGDSWGVHVLAGITLALFTAILGFFAWRIVTVARHAKKMDGSQEHLFFHKPYMRKYGLFYDQFKSNFWWLFLPLLAYAFARGAFIALGDGHGLVQTVGQLCCEVFLLALLLWNRPYNTKAGNVLNITISCVRVLSVVCLIVFVDQLGIAADAKTVTGVALIAIQSTLTGVLAICIAVNAIYSCIKENPHRKKRKEAEKAALEADLTPLDARDSLLSGPYGSDGKGKYQPAPVVDQFYYNDGAQSTIPLHHMTPAPERSYHTRNISQQGLVGSAAPMPLDTSYESYRGQHPPHSDIGVARG